MVQAPSRRDRVRAATIEEIKQTARRLLVAEGDDAVSLRAIAREMGMTAPALYRYFDNRDDLIANVIADIFTEIGEEIRTAIEVAGQRSGGDMTHKMIAACQQFRLWSLAHPAEFGLLFGTPLPTVAALQERSDVVAECAVKFSAAFLGLYLELWRRAPFPIPADSAIAPELRTQLIPYRDDLGVDLPLGAVLTFLRCWVRLYGVVSLEVFGHLRFALEDPAPMFDYTLTELAELVGLTYTPQDTP